MWVIRGHSSPVFDGKPEGMLITPNVFVLGGREGGGEGLITPANYNTIRRHLRL